MNKKYWLIVAMGLLIGGGIWWWSGGGVIMAPSEEIKVLSVEELPVPSPAVEERSQVSPDGSKTVGVVMEEAEETRITVNGVTVATRAGSEHAELSIPFNTFSPDNKYFFLQEKNESGVEYLVMRENGELVGEVGELFAKSHPEEIIVSLTGWAAPTLLILNAKSEREAKMTYWFEVPTLKFIRLSTYFY